ncbi:MAG: hypothetical protein EHM87_16290, partial [Burkholderiales bacterium]
RDRVDHHPAGDADVEGRVERLHHEREGDRGERQHEQGDARGGRRAGRGGGGGRGGGRHRKALTRVPGTGPVA